MVPNYSLSRAVRLLSVILGLLPLLWVSISQGQTTSLTSSGLGTTITPGSIDPAGRPNYIITGGTRPGDGPNLFHSFGDFSVGTNNVARFFNESGRATTNILSRVTGGSPSNIFGEISTQSFGSANFYLINPAGIVFGPNASLNLGGSGHFSSADYLRLGSGNDRFYADLGKTSQLTSAAVTAFGFLGERPAGPVTVQAGNPLAVNGGKSISLIGGDISITGRTLSAPGGQISLASVASGGEVIPSLTAQPPGLSPNGFTALGNITLTQETTIDTSSSAAGPIFIRGGQLVMDQSRLLAFTGDRSGGNIDVKAENIQLARFTDFKTVTNGVGSGGNINVKAENMQLTGNTGITTQTNGAGSAGDVNLEVGSLTATNHVQIGSTSNGSGRGGRSAITAGTVTLADDAIIANLVQQAGHGGALAVTATESLSILGEGTFAGISTEGNAEATGDSGNITISTPNMRMVNGGLIRALSVNGAGGDITITAGTMLLTGTAEITTRTEGAGRAGDINVKVGNLVAADGARFTTNTIGAGQGGDITLIGTESVSIVGANSIAQVASQLASNASGSGNAGSITVSVPVLKIEQGGVISALTLSTGNAGGITLNTGSLALTGQSQINASSMASGNSAGSTGQILIRGRNGEGSSAQSVTLDNSIISTTISGGSAASTPATIDLTAQAISLANKAQISADTSGNAPAGNITLNAGNLTVSSGANISSSSTSKSETAGSAGQIVIRGQAGGESYAQSLTLDSGTISTVVRGGSADTPPASIDIKGQSVTLANAALISAETQGKDPFGKAPDDTPHFWAPAGNIHIRTGTLVMTGPPKKFSPSPDPATTVFPQIIADTLGPGRGGDITINSTDHITISGGLIDSSSSGRTTGKFSGECSSTCGQAGNITITAPALTLESVESIPHGQPKDAAISTVTTGSGAGGNITLDVGSLLIRNSIMPSSLVDPTTRNGVSAWTRGSGDGGSIKIIADSVRLEHGLITAAGGPVGDGTVTGKPSGAPGTIDISAGSLTFVDGSLIRANNNGPTSVRTVNPDGTVTESGTVTIHGKGNSSFANTVSISDSTLFTGTTSTAKGGPLNIAANSITATDGAVISSSSSSTATGAGDAGSINLTSTDNIFIANSTVSTSASQASGGNIELTAPNMVRLVGANLTSSVFGSALTQGGNITIDTAHPQFVIMQGNSQILAKANEGQGGRITIIGGVVLQEPGSVLDATAGPAGISGSINIQAPFQQLSGAIAPLPQAFAMATNLYGQRCAAEKGGQFSSFVQGARDGVPPQPGDLIPSPLMLELDEAPLNTSLQLTSSLSAIRFGLPEFEQSSRSSLTVFAGCRS